MGNERTPVTPVASNGGSLVSTLNGNASGGFSLGQAFVAPTTTTAAPVIDLSLHGQGIATASTPKVTTPTTAGTMTTPATVVAPVATATAPAVASGGISKQDAADLNGAIQKLLSGKGYPNPLNGFRQVNYHFKLFMMNDSDVYEQAKSPASLAELRKQVANFPQVIIAETGSTTYDIKSVNIESLVGPNDETRNTNATNFTIEVVEPVGTGFLTALKVAAKALKIKNPMKCPYYLELRFNAYNVDGTYCANPLSGQGYDGDGAWLWAIMITAIETTFDARGGSYAITAMPFGEYAFDENHITAPQVVAFSGETLGAMADSLAANLTTAYVARHLDSSVKYAVQIHPLQDDSGQVINKDVKSFRFADQKPDENPNRMLSMDSVNGIPTANMQPDVKVSDALDWMLAATEEVQNLSLNRGNQQGSSASNSSGSKTIGGRYVFRVEPDVQLTGKYDYINDRYYKLITFHVRPFYTLFPITSQQQRDDARDTAVQKQMLLKIIGDTFLAKHYQYLYTGLNTEVTEFDVKANFSWNVLLDADEGARASNDVTTATAMLSDSAKNSKNGYNVVQIQKKIGDLTVLLDTAKDSVDKADGDVNDKQLTVDHLTGQTDNTDTQSAESMTSAANTAAAATSALAAAKITAAKMHANQQALVDQFTTLRAQQNELIANGILSGTSGVTGIVYAEQIVATQSTGKDPLDDFNLNISFAQGHNEASAATGTGVLGQSNRDRSSMGVLLDQLYAPTTTNLITIDIGIRGDPYWIGDSSLTRQIVCRSTNTTAGQKSTTPDFFKGDYMFLLTFRFPVQIGADYKPTFRKDDVFNGIYKVTRVSSSFVGGTFKQTLTGCIMPLMSYTKMFGFDGTTPSDKSDAASPAAKTAPSPASTPAVTATGATAVA